MLVIAHRGANKEALENSWSAFELAIACGAARIELDVQLSRDGHAVVLHDDELLRTLGVPGRISTSDRRDLAKLKLRNGEPLPFLDQVIERLLPRIELNIEIKGPSEALAAEVARLVDPDRRRDAVIVSSFCAEPLLWLRRHNPDIQRACLWSADTFQWPLFATLAPQVFLDRIGTKILHPHMGLVTENLMDQARARGWTVFAWAPMVGEERDREGSWAALRTYGVHGLCTNYPRQLRHWLEEAANDEREYRSHS